MPSRGNFSLAQSDILGAREASLRVVMIGLLAASACLGAGIIDRSDVILQKPNRQPSEAMPLGNGRLGLAVWSADGLTIQLNRADTMPGRLSPGQVVLPGLTKLTSATDYGAKLKLATGDFTEHGNGITATVYVQPDRDVVVVDVTGADPASPQSVLLKLWKPRQPQAFVTDDTALLAETWNDNKAFGATGETFGSLAALKVEATNPKASVEDAGLAVRVTFKPLPNGSFRVFVAAPHWTGGNAMRTAQSLLDRPESPTLHARWWQQFWNRVGPFQMTSADGSAEYLENLRALYLFMAAAEKGDPYPGSQAGTADMFSPLEDSHQWDPSAYWHFNLRMMVAANLAAGVPDLNASYFNLYRQNLRNIQQWTSSKMKGLPGVCVPETMRFNGQGYENETWTKAPGLNCDAGSPPYYNARTLSTGAEISLWIWQTYLATDDLEFLKANYPVMAESTRFLLAYSKLGSDNKRHTNPTNAHENQWDVSDSTNDISAMSALFPALIDAAHLLSRDAGLAAQAEKAFHQIPELPRTDIKTLKQQLGPEADQSASDAIGMSHSQAAEIHNSENVGLEPVWPYNLIGDRGALHELGVRTYASRPNVMQNDWSFDPLQAARLGEADEVQKTLLELTKKYQAYPSGLSNFVGHEFYVEQVGVVAAALEEALVQDYDGLLRIAPAWPKDWDVKGTVSIQHASKVTVEFRKGVLGPVLLEAGFTGKMRIRNPWPGQQVQVMAADRKIAATAIAADEIEFSVVHGLTYQLQGPEALPATGLEEHFASGPRRLGQRSIGLAR
jgi:alpha-L-fucosidase 2